MKVREPVAAYGKKKFTIEEYLQFENVSDENMRITRAKYLLCQGRKHPAMLFLLTNSVN
jgi:hypothetical protein